MRLLKPSLIGLLVFFVASVQANICFDLQLPPSNKWTFDDSIEIESGDGVRIAANVFSPKTQDTQRRFPAIIFVNSWVLDEHEYLLQAMQFAEKGYLVLSYSARGWGCSQGQVNVGGLKDMADLSAVIDWLQANTPVDATNIGISGISYGSGIAALGLALEPRIKTAVAMSTWASLSDALYQHQTPRLFWGFFLVSSGLLTANLEPEIAQNYWNLITHQSIPDVYQWADQRSVGDLVNAINDRNAPIYLANNFGDNLFQPNNLMKFFEALSVPKRLDLNQGTHASGEGFGLVGLNNYTWNNTHRWFDYWLKGEANGIMEEPSTSFELANRSTRESFNTWPPQNHKHQTLFLAPRGLFSQGDLKETPYNPWWTQTNTIHSGLDTTATTGIPVLSALLDAHLDISVTNYLPSISRINGIFFESGPLEKNLKLRGIPKLSLNLDPSYKHFQLNAYLYDVDSHGFAKLITHGPFTRYNATKKTQRVDWELVATAYNIEPGHKIAIALDTVDILYAPPTLLPYSIDFKFSTQQQSTLTLPYIE